MRTCLPAPLGRGRREQNRAARRDASVEMSDALRVTVDGGEVDALLAAMPTL